MLYLKSVELENFKSFKGEVTIPLVRGFTAITGPNGSGKSNIGDAIQFVLGTKSNKNIRADNVGDLIFNGGGSGKAARKCLVTLVFANESGEGGRRRMSVDSDEVRFIREVRLTKSGNTVSTYRLNGEESSRNHFRLLLAEANASADGYNIVLQGDVTNLTKMTPRNRRKVLDKVAGVTAYDDEIRRANSQRDKVDEFIERITILQTELSDQLGDLKKEREQALKAKDLVEELVAARIVLLQSKHRSRFDEILFLSDEQIRYNDEASELRNVVKGGEKELLALDDRVAELERQITEVLGDDAAELMERINQLHREIDRRGDQITDSESMIADVNEDIELLTSEEEEAKDAQSNHAAKFESAKASKKSAEEGLLAAEAAEKEARDALLAGDKRTHELTRALGKAGEVVSTSNEGLAKAQLDRDRAAQHVEMTAQRLSGSEEQCAEFQLSVDDLKLEGEDLGECDPDVDRAKLGAKLTTLQNSEKKLTEESEILENKFREAGRQLVVKRTELESHAGGRSGMVAAVQQLLQQRDGGQIKGIIGTISELCQPKDSVHELALATAIGAGGMSGIVVESDAVASQCMQWLRENKVGRAMFLPLNKLQTSRPAGRSVMVARESGVIGFAWELLDYDPRVESAVRYVLRDTLVVNDLATARRNMGGVRLVTLRGDVTERGGAMQGGAPMKIKTGFGGQLAGASEVEKLQAEVEHLRMLSETANGALAECRNQQLILREQINALTNDDTSLKLRQWREELRLAEERLSKSKGVVAEVTKQLAAAEKGLKAREDGLAIAVLALEQATENRDEASKALQEASPEHLQKMLRDAQELRVNAESQKAQADGTLSSGEGHGDIYADRVSEIVTRRERLAQENQERLSRIQELGQEIITLKGELSTVSSTHAQVAEEHKELDNERIKVTEERAGLRATLQQHAANAETLTNRANELTLSIQQKREGLAELNAEMDDLSVEPQVADANLPPVGEAEKTVNQLQRRVDAIGPVNMLAIAKYDVTLERVSALKGDNKQLSQRRKELLAIAERLEKQRKRRLLAVLKEVDRNFRKVYEELSGGRGELFLENPDEPFKGGLSMWAQPPGKSSKVKLEQLSGGEKSVASLALIFAIQDYDPSPFYYFDEVDQNLDPINSELIAAMCSRRSKQAQFIQVTLRKVSLQMADHHIGITHAGDGCSRRITNFNREKAIELGAAALAELNEGREEKERKDLQTRLGELPNPDEMERIPEELPTPDSLGGELQELSEQPDTESDGLERDVSAGEGMHSLRDRADELSEDIELEQTAHKETLADSDSEIIEEDNAESIQETVE